MTAGCGCAPNGARSATQIKLLDAAFEVRDGTMQLDPSTFRGEFPQLLAFAGEPLERVTT